MRAFPQRHYDITLEKEGSIRRSLILRLGKSYFLGMGAVG